MKSLRILDNLYDGYISDNNQRKNLNLVILAAAIGTIFFSQSTGAATTGLASAFGANDFVFGLMWALPVFASLAQLYASYLIEKTGKNRKIFLIFGIIQRGIWLIVALLPYLVPEVLAHTRIWFMVVILTLSSIAATFVNAGFYSFFADMVPMGIRGRYISFRSRICTIFSMISGLAAAWVLDSIPGFPGYTLVFAVASVFGVLDIVVFFWVDTPPIKQNSSNSSVIAGLKLMYSDKKVLNYILFWSIWSFAINLSSPFFTKYTIEVQGLSFTQIIIFGQIACNVVTILALPLWGRALDRYGSKPVLFFSCTVTAILILVWFPADKGSVLPLFIFNALGGLVWCAGDIASQNMLLSHTPETGRSMVTSIYFVTNAIGSAIAFTLGGAFLELTKPFFSQANLSLFGWPIDHYKSLFALSIIARLLPIIFVLPKVWSEKEFDNNTVLIAFISSIKTFFMRLYYRIIKR